MVLSLLSSLRLPAISVPQLYELFSGPRRPSMVVAIQRAEQRCAIYISSRTLALVISTVPYIFGL